MRYWWTVSPVRSRSNIACCQLPGRCGFAGAWTVMIRSRIPAAGGEAAEAAR